MANTVYILSALTSLVCAVLLARGYLRARARLLLWSSLCFAGLAINNLLLVVDRILFPTVDMYEARLVTALIAVAVLVYGLVWDLGRNQ